MTMALSVVAEAVSALRAPTTLDSDYPAYYYVSDGISDNGKFPYTWVGFYWDSDSGSRTITYNPRKCNDGGYDDSSDGDPRVTIYGLNANGTVNTGNVIKATTHINACHNSSGSTNFTFDLSQTQRDTNINMKGVAVLVDSNGDGNSRAWFSLETASTDGASFGALGGRPIGYSRDLTGSAGSYYDLETGFGSCASNGGIGTVAFYDTDNSKYQDDGSGTTNALRIQFVNLTTGLGITNTSPLITNKQKISARSGTTYQFNVLANSGETASLDFNMDINSGYQLKILHLREGNDITVQVPTNEIYGKRACMPMWTMSGYTTVSTATAVPGQQVTFTHHVVNNGPDTTNRDVWSDTQVSGGVGTAKSGQNFYQFAAGQNKTTFTDTITVPNSALSGTQYCQRVGYQWSAYNNSAYGSGGWACVTVQASYALTPSTNLSATAVIPGEAVTATPLAQNAGTATASAIHWEMKEVIFAPGVPVSEGTRSGTNAAQFGCSYYAGIGASSCVIRTQANGASFPKNTTTTLTPYTKTDTGSLTVGSRICFATLVTPYTQDGGNYREALSCTTVAAAPYLSVVGGNTWAGGSVLSPYSGSASIRGSRASSFGSFDEYGVFATSTIDYFGSAGQLGGARTTLGAINGSRLTFGSRTGTLGSFTDSHQIAGLVSYYAGASHTASVLGGAGNTTVQGSGVYVVSGTGTVSLTAIAANANPHAVIYAPQGTVRIDGPLVYSYAGASTFKDLPSLTVIADTIVVAGSVNQITGNFYATNKFITCNEGPWNSSENATKSSALTTTGACAAKLVVNGTVTVANQSATALVLNRSYGGTTTGQPAEMIRMRPEAVLSPYEQNLMFTTIQESELPARY